ncbi:hypothetical protein [Aestuariirhabdus sp. LZHN29]
MCEAWLRRFMALLAATYWLLLVLEVVSQGSRELVEKSPEHN